MDLQNYHEWIAVRQRLLERIKELEAENAELRKRLGEDVVPIKQEPYAMQTLSLQEKVGLFRSLFRGREDVLAFVDVCKSWSIPCSVERSRSGNGSHVWIFFETPVLAVKARRLGNAILTEAMNRNGKISFKSYDRFFPNQDTLP